VRCSRCGNDNPETNRFCGTCGASLLPAPPPPVAVRSESVSEEFPTRTPAAPRPAAPRAAAPVYEQVPAISGPSFLGLNVPAPRNSDRGSDFSAGSQSSRSSGNLDYLLDDDDQPKGGAGKVFLILIALALAVGFGYLRWRHEGLSALMSGWQKPSATAQNSDSSQPASSTGTQSSAPELSSPANQPPPTPSQPAATQSTASPGTDSSSSPATGPNASPSGTNAPGSTADGQPPGNPAPTPGASASSAADSLAQADKPEAKPAAKDEPPATADSTEPDPHEKAAEPAPVPKRAARSPATAKPSAAASFDQVTEAEKYVYGRGERQDCDRGLRMLRPAAEQSNSRAMISLGALYSTGVCTPRDLPTAYRWFALALRKQPDNQPLQENLQRLWAQMTQPERQLAIKLSQ
jgi:zinc ribbon protein